MIATPTQPAPLRTLLEAALRRRPSEVALTLGGERWTCAQLDEFSMCTARALLERGVAEGDVVMVLCGNGIPIVATWFACISIGAVFTPLNALLTGEALRAAVLSAHGAVLVGEELLLAAAGLRVGDPAHLRHVLASDGIPGSGRESFEKAVAATGRGAVPQPARGSESAAKLMFTSGTTGEPKGVVWSRATEALHAVNYGDELVRIEPGETVYSCLPLFHATCQGTLIGTLLRGGSAVIDRRFDPFSFWRRTRESGAVFFPYVGTIISTLYARPPRADDRDNPVQRAMGSAAPADRWAPFEERFGLKLEDVWGQTETASCWTRPNPGRARAGTVGHPAERFEARVVSADGSDVAVAEPGELWIRGRVPHALFSGYLGSDGTIGDPLDGDGWYHTGDWMSCDTAGEYAFHGRIREAIRRRGEMIAPATIESAACRHAAVAEAAAVGVPAADGVEDEVLLCVVPRDDVELDVSALHTYLSRELPPFMVPRYIRTMAELPKTPTTRVRRHLLPSEAHAAWDTRRIRRRHGW